MKMTIVLLALAIAGFLFYRVYRYLGGSPKVQTTHIAYGPFTVITRAISGRTFNVNYGMVNSYRVEYDLQYRGKPIAYDNGLEQNTGLPFIWNIYALAGAPDPTLIVGSQNLYMVYEENGKAVVKPLLTQHHDFASMQFLDSENGQPGRYFEVYMKSDISAAGKLDTLDGGRLLMAGEESVLDVKTREWRKFRENNAKDNYSFPSPHGALALSPDQKSVVFRAEFQSWNARDEDLPESEHALAVCSLVDTNIYIIPYDDTEMRVTTPDDIQLEWLNTYFEWIKTPSGDRLQVRKLDHPPYWTGRLNERDYYYHLYPVKADMLPVFLAFVKSQMGWTDANLLNDKFHEYTGRRLEFGDENIRLDICLKEDEREITFSNHLYAEMKPEYQSVIKRISSAFNAELAAGKHQEHFIQIINQTKKIRGVH